VADRARSATATLTPERPRWRRWIAPGGIALGFLALVALLTQFHMPRDGQLTKLCDRGELLKGAHLLDEAAVVYTRASEEGGSCAKTPLVKVTHDQGARSDAIESARAYRLLAAHRSRDDARGFPDLAYQSYLVAFELDVRSPGARKGLRRLLRVQERANPRAFEDRKCTLAAELLKARLLYEARALSGIARAPAPGAACPDQRTALAKSRRAAALAASRGDGLAAAGHPRRAFSSYIDALTSDPSSAVALDGLRQLPAIPIPKKRSFAQAGGDAFGSVANGIGPALPVLGLLLAVGLVLRGAWVSGRNRRDERRQARRRAKARAATTTAPTETVAPPVEEGALPRGAERHLQITTTQPLYEAGEREAVELVVEAMRRPGLLLERPAESIVEAAPRFLDMMPARSAESALPPVLEAVAIATGADSLTRAWNVGRKAFTRNPDELPVRFVPDSDMEMELQLPRRFGGESVRASAAELPEDAPTDPRQRRNAVARLLGQRALERLEQ
jgi:hypothetical protein